MDDIALLNDQTPNTGVGRYAFSLFKALRKLTSYELKMIVLKSDYLYGRIIPNNLIPNSFTYVRFMSLMRKLLSHISKFGKVINQNYRLYHVTDVMLHISSNFYPYIVTVHHPIPFMSIYEDMLTRFGASLLRSLTIDDVSRNLSCAEKTICVSNYVSHELQNIFNLNPSDIHVVYHGVDHDLFRLRDERYARLKLKLPLTKQIIINVGEDNPRKNISTLLKAFLHVRRAISDVILIRIANKDTTMTRKIARRLGLDSKMLYFEGVSDKELAYFYNSADVLVFPSYYEGFGFPPLEAMSSGCAVITSNRTAMPEIVGNAGILLDPNDIDAFTHEIIAVLTDDVFRSKLIKSGLERSKLFSWEKCARETLEVYKKVLEN